MKIASEGLALLDDKDRTRHIYVVGQSGSGKTNFMHSLMDFSECNIIIDPKGDLANLVARYAPEERLKVISKKHPAVLNPLNRPGLDWSEIAVEFAGALDNIISATTSSPDQSTLMRRILSNAVWALNGETKKRNIASVAKLLEFESERNNYRHHPYWKTFDYREFNQYVFKEARDSAKRIANRLANFTDSPIINRFVDGKNEFDVAKFARDKSIVVLNLAGFDNDTKIYLGVLALSFIESYYNHLEAEPYPRVYVYVDEFFRLKYYGFEQLLSQSRSFNLAFCVAHQDTGQISESVVSSILGNCFVMAGFSCGTKEAKMLADRFGKKPEDFLQLPKYHCICRIGRKNHLIETFPPPKEKGNEQYCFWVEQDDSWIEC